MKSLAFGQILILLFVWSPPFALGEAAPSLKVVDGRVKQVLPEKQELVLSYRHPVTGQWEELILKVDRQTGFSEGVRFEELQENDPLSIDYQENAEGNARAVRINRVPLTADYVTIKSEGK